MIHYMIYYMGNKCYRENFKGLVGKFGGEMGLVGNDSS